MIYVDENNWVKAGIEYTDGMPRLSCVVTNSGYSDWSTQKWPHFSATDRSTSVRIRVSKLLPGHEQGPCLMMEAAGALNCSRPTDYSPRALSAHKYTSLSSVFDLTRISAAFDSESTLSLSLGLSPSVLGICPSHTQSHTHTHTHLYLLL